ncbi:MAG: helix-turn-helix domain-containing protein [Chloroflexota bacterium]|nr:helix-turn-helix domain-containing protein [Chloroflexota bacterium]
MDAVRLGRQIRALRRRRGWRQVDLAARAGLSRATIARVELGGAEDMPLRTLGRIATAMSARLDARLLWNGESLDRLLDQTHAALVEELTTRLGREGWVVAPEVSFSIFGERGSIDLLAFHPRTSLILVVEVKSALPDLQAMLVTLDRKARLASRIAQDRGWQPAGVARLLVLPNERTARRCIGAHAALLGTAFPTRGVEVNRWLRKPDRPISGLVFVSGVRAADPRHRVGRRNVASTPDSVSGAALDGHLSRSP